MKLNVYADGGSRGNPGIAGSGTAVFDAETKQLLQEIVYVVGKKATNNVAEYHGLLRGLAAAAELGAREVYVFMDSKLVVEQMSGRWKIKHPDMQKLAREARELAGCFERVAYTWIPRAQNAVADKLSNDAMDAAAAGHPVGVVGGKQPQGVTAEIPTTRAILPTGSAEPAGVPSPAWSSTLNWWKDTEHPPTRLVLLRHGQTDYSLHKRYAGRADAELNATGHRQVAAAAESLAARGGIDAIVTSPLLRCRATAEAAARRLDLRPRVIEDLQECDFGNWDGMTFTEAQEDDPEHHSAWVADGTMCPPGGESYEQVNQRVERVRRRLILDYPGQTVLVVSHVNPIKSLVRQALGGDAGIYQRMHLDLASFCVIDFFPEVAEVTPVLLGFNDTGHLR